MRQIRILWIKYPKKGVRSFTMLGDSTMSSQLATDDRLQIKKAKAAARRARKEHCERQQYAAKVENLTMRVVDALKRSRHGVVYADSEDLLLKIIAIEVGLIEEFPTLQAAERHARHVDSQIGYRKHTQGDRQQIMHDAVNVGIRTKRICDYHDQDSGRMALYVPQNLPPKWTVFFATAERGIHDYIPSKRDLAIATRVNDYNEIHDNERVPHTGQTQALLRAWGQQFDL